MKWEDSYDATIIWLNEKEGGRKCPPQGNQYCPIARFPHENENSSAWSVRVHIITSFGCENHMRSQVLVKYFNKDEAPNENFRIYDHFDLYEGARLVGHVILNTSKTSCKD